MILLKKLRMLVHLMPPPVILSSLGTSTIEHLSGINNSSSAFLVPSFNFFVNFVNSETCHLVDSVNNPTTTTGKHLISTGMKLVSYGFCNLALSNETKILDYLHPGRAYGRAARAAS